MRTAEEEFIDGFGGGNFRDRGKMAPQTRANLSEQLAVRQVDQSHTAGFEAWMRHGTGWAGWAPKEVLTVDMQDIPPELEWGEVLVSMRMMPINPADLYTIHTGGLYGNDPPVKAPLCQGMMGLELW
eukprot:jgi/Picre1/32811/NNA_008141.t1